MKLENISSYLVCFICLPLFHLQVFFFLLVCLVNSSVFTAFCPLGGVIPVRDAHA